MLGLRPVSHEGEDAQPEQDADETAEEHDAPGDAHGDQGVSPPLATSSVLVRPLEMVGGVRVDDLPCADEQCDEEGDPRRTCDQGVCEVVH